MNETNETPEGSDESDYAQHLLWRMTGSKITSIGVNQDGEVYISTDSGVRVIVGKDEAGDVALFEILEKTA
jgi:hypothetical protein